jgi:hypothetical protein
MSTGGALLVSALCLVPPAVVSADLSGLYPPRQEQNSFLKWWHPQSKFCYSCMRVLMMTKAVTGDLQCNMSSIKISVCDTKILLGIRLRTL